MSDTTDGVKLPPGYEDAKDVQAVRLPPGYEDAKDVKPSSTTQAEQHPAGWRAPIDKKQEQPGLLDRADKAITDTLATNPKNLKSFSSTNLIEVPKTLGREVYSGAKTALGLIPGAYHLLTPELTDEEKREGYTDTGRFGPVQVKRLVEPAVQAAKDYASGRVGYQDILENAPEALGEGAGTVVGGKLIEEGVNKTAKALRNADPTALVTAPVRLGARTTESLLNQKITPIKPILKIMTPADTADAVQIKVPGRDYGLIRPKPTEPLYEGPDYTEGTPAEPIGSLTPKGRVPYPSEKTPRLITEEGLTGSEHTEGSRELIPTGKLEPKTRVGYAPIESSEPPTEPGLVGRDYTEGKPSEPTGLLPPKSRVGYPAIEEDTPSVEPDQLIPEETKPGNVKTLRAKNGKVIDTDPNNLQQLLEESLDATRTSKGMGKTEAPKDATSDLSNTLIENKEAVEPAVKAVKGKTPANVERSPEAADAEPAVTEQVSNLTDDRLRKLARAHGLDPNDYDFDVRDERRARTDRIRLTNDIVRKMSNDEVQNLIRSAQSLQHGPDASSLSKAQRAEKIFPRLRGPVDQFGNPKVSGGSQAAEPETTSPNHYYDPWSQESKPLSSKLRDDALREDLLYKHRTGDPRGLENLINEATKEAPAKPVVNNASGESVASQEAVNRTASDKAKGIKYFRLDTRRGTAVPLIGPDRVDATAGDYDEIIRVGKDGMETVLDRGSKARPRLRSSRLFSQ